MSSPDPRLANGWQPDYEPVMLADVLSPGLCQRAIELAHTVGFESSPVFQGGEAAENQYYRKSETAWLEPDDFRELYQRIVEVLQTTNNARFRFSIYGMDKIQIIRYVTGSFFINHADLAGAHAANRKISLLVQLSDPVDYDGGNVVLAERLTVPRARGGGCIFPSWVLHRVEEITRGTRYSLAAWAKGAIFS
jgi:PKHD-type hydroxylase